MKKRHGFTLVELLTVIIIISLLAGMISGAAYYAVTSVNQSVIRQEISQLELALNAYKAEFGEYPPDNESDAVKHIQRCYPNATNTKVWCTKLTPATALVVFLGPRCADPTAPFATNPYSSDVSITKPFFEFDKNRISEISSGDYGYLPRGCTEPYYYLKAKQSKGRGSYNTSGYSAYQDLNGDWYNENSFQIISAGLDNDYGTDGDTVIIKEGNTDLTSAVLNNITNFAPRQVKDLLD